MASSGAIRGYKGFVRIGRGATPTWTKLVGVPSFTTPEQVRPDIDATHLESPGDTEEAIPGMKPLASWTLEMDHVPGSDSEVLLRDLADTGETVQIELNWPDDNTYTTFDKEVYAGYVKAYTITVDGRQKLTASIPFTIMGTVSA